MYGENGMVYHWLNGEYYVLYDFNAQAGDTIYHQAAPYTVNDPITQVYGQTANRFYSTVDSVSTINLNGQSRRVLHLAWTPDFVEGDWGFVSGNPARIIEGIGSIKGLTGDWYRLKISLGHTYLALVCYQDDVVQYEWLGLYPTCDIVSSVEPIDGSNNPSKIQLFAANGELHVQTTTQATSQYYIFDVRGRAVKEDNCISPKPALTFQICRKASMFFDCKTI